MCSGCNALMCEHICGHKGLSIKQSVSINGHLNDPVCQQHSHMRVAFTVRDKVREAILSIIKKVLSRYWCHLFPDKDGYTRLAEKHQKSAALMLGDDQNGGWPWWKNQLTLAWKWTAWSFSTILFVDKYNICCWIRAVTLCLSLCVCVRHCFMMLWLINLVPLLESLSHVKTLITYWG